MSVPTFPLHRFIPRPAWLRGFRCRYSWLDTPTRRKDAPPAVDYVSLLREIDDFHRKLAK